MELIVVADIGRELSRRHYEQLEQGHILFFPQTPIELSAEDRNFLLSQQQSGASYHKNIAYRPQQDIVTGAAGRSDRERLRHIMKSYCQEAARLLSELLPRYAQSWRLDFTSFRPQQEEGRKLPLRSRNDLLHVDAFPSRPTNGARILRLFTNINPEQPRVWLVSDNFEALARRYAHQAGLLEIARPRRSPLRRILVRLARSAGFHSAARSPYDAFMLRFHNFLKENRRFQETCPKRRLEFPPNSSWLVFTDMVSHAVLSGRYALEQTFIVSRGALALPEKAPASILEEICGLPLTTGVRS